MHDNGSGCATQARCCTTVLSSEAMAKLGGLVLVYAKRTCGLLVVLMYGRI